MDYQKFVGMHIWVPEAGPIDEHGHNAEICWVFSQHSAPDRLNVNARVLGQTTVIHNLNENVSFFWTRPVTERPFTEKQIFVNVYSDGNGMQAGTVHTDEEMARARAQESRGCHLITLTGTIIEKRN